MTRWTNDAQKALASALGEKDARGHDTELIIFALQLKLQAGLRLMNEDYVRSMLHKPNHTDERSLEQTHLPTKGSLEETKDAVQEDTNAKCMVVAKTKRVHFEKMDSKVTSASDVSTSSSECNLASKEHVEPDAEPSDVESPIARHMDLEGMTIEASSAVNATIFRAARRKLARTSEAEVSESHDVPRIGSEALNIEASSAINASIFRAQRNRICREGEGEKKIPQIDSQDMKIEASSAINASIFRKELKRVARTSEKDKGYDLRTNLQDGGAEASCALNASIFRAERNRIARETGEGRNIKPRTRSSPNLRLERCRPSSLDDDVCGREFPPFPSFVPTSWSTPKFSAL
jgi:hypothetical protein